MNLVNIHSSCPVIGGIELYCELGNRHQGAGGYLRRFSLSLVRLRSPDCFSPGGTRRLGTRLVLSMKCTEVPFYNDLELSLSQQGA